MRAILRSATSLSTVAIGIGALALTASQPAAGATCVWLGGAGLYGDAGGWSCAAIPTAADDVVIAAGGSVVSVSGSRAFGTLSLGGGNEVAITSASLTAHGDASNNGTIRIQQNSYFYASGANRTISGNGTIILDDTAGYARIAGTGGGGFTFGAGQTVRGSGAIGQNGAVIVNHGLIHGDVAGRSIALDPAGGNGGAVGFTNNGIIRASNGGSVRFEGGRYDNSAGLIEALAGSTVDLASDARIIGGLLQGAGQFTTGGGVRYLQDVTLATGGNMAVTSATYLHTSLTNDGTITVSNSAYLWGEGAALAINGNGAIVLDNSAGYARLYSGGGRMTIGAAQTVRGSGEVGFGGTILVNEGLIHANVDGGMIVIDSIGGNAGVTIDSVPGQPGATNNGIIRASNGGTIRFDGGRYDNSNGVIEALADSTVHLASDARIIGGLLQGSGQFTTGGGTRYLQGVTLAAGGNMAASNGSTYLHSSLTNDGTITVSNNAYLYGESASLLIDGSGTIILDDTAGYARIDSVNGYGITIGASQTVRGSGEIGRSSSILVNNGLIEANAIGRTLVIDSIGGSGGVTIDSVPNQPGATNNGIIRASNGGTLRFDGGRYDNSAGVIEALAGSTVHLASDARIIGGLLQGPGQFTTGGGVRYLQDVTLASGGNMNVASGGTYLHTTLTNDGTITVSNNGYLYGESASLLIDGSGTIILDDSAGYARIDSVNGYGITIGANQTVRGSGAIGLSSTILVNNGLIEADVLGRTLVIDAYGGSAGVTIDGVPNQPGASNNGIIRASNGGTLRFDGGRYDNSAGVIEALAGATVELASDARIIGGVLQGAGQFTTGGGVRYLQEVALAAGGSMAVTSATYLHSSLTNDGTISVSNNAYLWGESAVVAIGGGGTIILDDTAGYARLYGTGTISIGAAQTVRGSGELGSNSTILVNNGLIHADVSGRTLTIDPAGGSGGVGGEVAFTNTGIVRASNGGTANMVGGRYDNSTGTFHAGDNGSISFANDANLVNLAAGGVLSGGTYHAESAGSGALISLRGVGAGIVSIGAASGPATTVILQGTGSVIQALPISGGTAAGIDNTLAGVGATGTLSLIDRDFAVVANSGAFSNAGLVTLNNSVFGASSFANSGTVRAIAGSNQLTVAITGNGSIITDAGATLGLGGHSTAAYLSNNGTLALGANNITVATDYQNGSFGAGNAFNHRNNVTGSGLILASSATMDVTGADLAGGVLHVGNVRVGGSSSTDITITNNGAQTLLRGAVQNNHAPGVAIAGADFVLNPNGGAATATISFSGATAGSLAGQTIDIVNNFDNVANSTLAIDGNVYQIAVAGAQPASITLAAQRVGGPGSSDTLSIANTAPDTGGFTEALQANAGVGGPFTLNGGATVSTGNIAAGGSQAINVALGTGTAGAFTGTITIENTSVPVAGSGLDPLALGSQTVQLSGNVYAVAVAGVSTTTVDFGAVRQGTAGVTAGTTVSNNATGALTDDLATAISGVSAPVSTLAAPGTLAAGQSGTALFGLDTSTAGVIGGTADFAFTSVNAEMTPLALGSESVSFAGVVTQLAEAVLIHNGGAGTLTGSGSSYVLDLGSFTAGAGSVSTDIGVLNDILASAFAESLGGSFIGGAGAGYSFLGNAFAGLGGGDSSAGNWLTFDYTGLGNGNYNSLLTFNGYSQFAGLADQALAPITLDIRASVTGGEGPVVPEPATWAMLILGFGVVGTAMRRRRPLAA